MADNFLAKWLRPANKIDPAVADARAELKRVAAEWPELPKAIGWLDKLLPALAAPLGVSPCCVSAPAAQAKLARGVPLLFGESLTFNAKAFRRRWHCLELAMQDSLGDGRAEQLAAAVRTGKLDVQELLNAILSDRSGLIKERSVALGLDPVFTETFLRIFFFPAFCFLNAARARDHRDAVWRRGYCPTCGNWPLLGEFRGLAQKRYLRCGWCAAAWKVPRLFCPYCGNRDHGRLGFLLAEGEEKRIVSTCGACGHYVKMLTTLSELPPLGLWVADLASLHLDVGAHDHGFHL